MIKTKVKPEQDPDGDGLLIKREIIIKGDAEDLANDLRAIAHGLAKRARRDAKSKHEEQAIRTRFETAFAEGLRMNEEELKEADKIATEKILNEIMEEIESEWIKENGGMLS